MHILTLLGLVCSPLWLWGGMGDLLWWLPTFWALWGLLSVPCAWWLFGLCVFLLFASVPLAVVTSLGVLQLVGPGLGCALRLVLVWLAPFTGLPVGDWLWWPSSVGGVSCSGDLFY